MCIRDSTRTRTHTAPPLPPLSYSDQLQAHTIDYGIPQLGLSINTSAASYAGRVQWWVNGVLATAAAGSSQKYTVSDDMRTLTVSNIVLTDSGLYQAELLDSQPAPQFLTFQIDVRKYSHDQWLYLFPHNLSVTIVML